MSRLNELPLSKLEPVKDALVHAYPEYFQIEQLVAFALNINLKTEIGGPGEPLSKIAYNLLLFAQGKGLAELLVREAIARTPGNPKLRRLAQEFGLAPAPFNNVVTDNSPAVAWDTGFEARVLSSGMKTGDWRAEMVLRERRVCQILFRNEAIGTGFLVSPDLIMSNWHVFQTADGNRLAALDAFAARFDYRASDPKNVASLGTLVSLDSSAGYLDSSDKQQLDYVIVKLSRSLGSEPIDGLERRGWLELSGETFQKDEPAIILQHPQGRTLELAIGIILGWLPGSSETVYEHRADTENGSSGSPCFSSDWKFLGLHHRVDPVTGDRNRAVATAAVLSRMGVKGTIGLLPSV